MSRIKLENLATVTSIGEQELKAIAGGLRHAGYCLRWIRIGPFWHCVKWNPTPPFFPVPTPRGPKI